MKVKIELEEGEAEKLVEIALFKEPKLANKIQKQILQQKAQNFYKELGVDYIG